MKEYEVLTRALLRSDPTDKLAMPLVVCMAWSRQNLGTNKKKIENEMGEMSCLCKMLLGSSQRNKNKTYIVGTVLTSHNSE